MWPIEIKNKHKLLNFLLNSDKLKCPFKFQEPGEKNMRARER